MKLISTIAGCLLVSACSHDSAQGDGCSTATTLTVPPGSRVVVLAIGGGGWGSDEARAINEEPKP